MSKPVKILLGIATVLPFLLFAGMFGEILPLIIELAEGAQTGDGPASEDPLVILRAFAGFFGYLLFAILLSIALFVIYLVHAINNKSITGSERVAWILVIIFVGHLGYIIYWIIHIWKYKTPSVAPASPPEEPSRNIERG